MSDQHINISGDKIPISNDRVNIFKLKFLSENPRVYTVTREEPGFDEQPEEKQQDIIFKKLLKEQSVKNLIPDIKRHGGLTEPILIRHDTMEVIEGNSRLAAYKKLYSETQEEQEQWELISCQIVSSLTGEQLAAYLHQLHVKGKTSWTAYEKANFTYVRYKDGWPPERIAKEFGVTKGEVRKRIKTIDMMEKNEDSKQSRFSYYDVLVRNSKISKAMQSNEKVNDFLLGKIREVDPDTEVDPGTDDNFTALDLRNKLPVILNKPKVLKKLLGGGVNFDEAYQNAKVGDAHQRVRKARETLIDVEKRELEGLDQNAKNALIQDFRRLKAEIKRIGGILGINDR